MTTTPLLPTGNLSGYSIEIRNDTTTPPVGHSFIVITGPDGFQQSYGLVPNSTSTTAFAPGAVIDADGHVYQTTTGSLPLTASQYSSLSQFINSSIDNPPYYNALQGEECSIWAIQAFDQAYGFQDSLSAPPNAVSAFVQSLLYNPYSLSGVVDGINATTIINANLDALAQYGQSLLQSLFSNNATAQTITNGDGSSFVIQSTSTGGTINFYDPSDNNAGTLQFLNEGNGVCTITNPSGMSSVVANGQLLTYVPQDIMNLSFSASAASLLP
jgi:hypothetical protein